MCNAISSSMLSSDVLESRARESMSGRTNSFLDLYPVCSHTSAFLVESFVASVVLLPGACSQWPQGVYGRTRW